MNRRLKGYDDEPMVLGANDFTRPVSLSLHWPLDEWRVSPDVEFHLGHCRELNRRLRIRCSHCSEFMLFDTFGDSLPRWELRVRDIAQRQVGARFEVFDAAGQILGFDCENLEMDQYEESSVESCVRFSCNTPPLQRYISSLNRKSQPSAQRTSPLGCVVPVSFFQSPKYKTYCASPKVGATIIGTEWAVFEEIGEYGVCSRLEASWRLSKHPTRPDVLLTLHRGLESEDHLYVCCEVVQYLLIDDDYLRHHHGPGEVFLHEFPDPYANDNFVAGSCTDPSFALEFASLSASRVLTPTPREAGEE